MYSCLIFTLSDSFTLHCQIFIPHFSLLISSHSSHLTFYYLFLTVHLSLFTDHSSPSDFYEKVVMRFFNFHLFRCKFPSVYISNSHNGDKLCKINDVVYKHFLLTTDKLANIKMTYLWHFPSLHLPHHSSHFSFLFVPHS